jgi:hypothetical protein
LRPDAKPGEHRYLAEQFPSTRLATQAVDRTVAGGGRDPQPGLGGRPSPGHLRKATENASCSASSARSMSPKTRIRAATERPDSSRRTTSSRAQSHGQSEIVLLRGKVLVENGNLVAQPGVGQFVRRVRFGEELKRAVAVG